MRLILTLTCLYASSLNASIFTQFSSDDIVYREFHVADSYYLEDQTHQIAFYGWDNNTPAGYDVLADDPLVAIRTKIGGTQDSFNIMDSWANWTHFSHFTYPTSVFGDKMLPEYLKTVEKSDSYNSELTFDHTPPVFELPSQETVVWQISGDPNFNHIISNLSGIAKGRVTLDPLSETFLNNDQVYYFRWRNKADTQWSSALSFKVLKPEPVNPEFTQDDQLLITWDAEPNTRYFIFASNAIDFVPEIYTESQLDGVDSSGNLILSPNKNLLTITESGELAVDDSLCFYRVVAERQGVYSVPSPLIYVYSRTQNPKRTFLERSSASNTLERVLFPSDKSYKTNIPMLSTATKVEPNVKPSHVSNAAWNAVQPWIMPLNHAARGPLDRIFSKERVLHSKETLEKAGFTNSKPGNGSQTIVTTHPKVPHYVLKLFLDNQNESDWENWVNRASIAEQVRITIKERKYFPILVAPYKWIYPLPPTPRADPSLPGKNFILVVDQMPLLPREDNKKRWARDMDEKRLDAIYDIIQTFGLINATHINNLPWSRNLRNVFVDFERHHVWPTQIQNLQPWLNPDMQRYLQQLIQTNGM